MKKNILMAGILSIFLFSACAIHFPFLYEDYEPCRIVFHIDPDDAQILLNGRFVGEAYEFATPSSALMLRSRRNEIVIRRDGFMELEINLYDYPNQNITIEKSLRRERAGGPATAPEVPAESKPIPRKETVREPEEELPQTSLEEPAVLSLTISPDDSSIYINGKFWGIVPIGGKIENLRLKPEKYTIQIVKPGFKYYEKNLSLTNGQKLNLEINLSEL